MRNSCDVKNSCVLFLFKLPLIVSCWFNYSDIFGILFSNRLPHTWFCNVFWHLSLHLAKNALTLGFRGLKICPGCAPDSNSKGNLCSVNLACGTWPLWGSDFSSLRLIGSLSWSHFGQINGINFARNNIYICITDRIESHELRWMTTVTLLQHAILRSGKRKEME